MEGGRGCPLPTTKRRVPRPLSSTVTRSCSNMRHQQTPMVKSAALRLTWGPLRACNPIALGRGRTRFQADDVLSGDERGSALTVQAGRPSSQESEVMRWRVGAADGGPDSGPSL